MWRRINQINTRIRDVGDMLDARDRLHPPPNTRLRKELQSVSDDIIVVSQRGAAFLGMGPGNFLYEMSKGVLDRYYVPTARTVEASNKFFDATELDAEKMEKSLDTIQLEVEKEIRHKKN